MEVGRFSAKTPAKLNLFLRITGKRADGYHDIYSLFVPINIYDEVILEPSSFTSLFSSDKNIPLNGENIILKTHAILKETCGLKDDFKITLIKDIPVGAGLGGGSSDAAAYATLVNKVSRLGLSYEDMVSVMKRVGSDTAFFLKPRPSLASGRGEILEEFKGLPELYFLIVNPGINVSTKGIYADKNLLLTDKALLPNLKKAISFQDLGEIMKNDMEYPVFSLFPRVKALKETLSSRGECFALMSGSGSTVFGVFENKSERDKAFEDMIRAFPEYYIRKAETVCEGGEA